VTASAVLFLALRRLRAPLIYLIVVFAAGIVGLALIPGVDADGRVWHLTVSQAFYFMAFTASTIGYGELPQAFTDTQRLWVTLLIFASVFGWAWLIASLLALAQDRAFRAALVATRFRRRVRALREPFYVICGFGETGLLVGRALDAFRRRLVVIELNEARAEEIELLELSQDVPVLNADAGLPEQLLSAGLAKPECRGVLALTNDDKANLAVAMSVRLLNPKVQVLARAMSRETAANMASFDTDHILNPFARFGAALALALASPGSYRLFTWLTGLPGTKLGPDLEPPRGRWVVCGYGRFGREVVDAFRKLQLDVTVIDPAERPVDGLHAVRGAGTEAAPLIEAGIRDAVGIVAGTDDDVTNLSIAVTARELNKSLFTIVRQNLQANRALFKSYAADITMFSSEIVANECLALLKTPLLERFLKIVRERDDAWADAVIAKVQDLVGERVPDIWGVTITPAEAPALYRAIARKECTITLGDMLRNPLARDSQLALVPLLHVRERNIEPMPAGEIELAAGDALLFAGRTSARRAQRTLLSNVNVRDYVVKGIEVPGGWVWQRFAPPRTGR
jgi:voltage-gated potassium channel